MLGKKARYENALTNEYPVELESPQVPENLINVSSQNREAIVSEEITPIMYFYLTCRHQYQELTSKFDYNRAYFVAINEISFMRHSYESTYDGELYIESGGDTENAEINEFVINDNGTWTTF